MSERSFGEEFSSELGKVLVGKAVMWGPSIAGVLLLGPIGLFLGLGASVAIVKSVCDDSPSPSGDEQPKD